MLFNCGNPGIVRLEVVVPIPFVKMPNSTIDESVDGSVPFKNQWVVTLE